MSFFNSAPAVLQMFSGYQCEIYFRSPVPLGAVFDGLARLGQLDILFSELSKRLREEVIGPLLSARYVPPPKVMRFPIGSGRVGSQMMTMTMVIMEVMMVMMMMMMVMMVMMMMLMMVMMMMMLAR